MLKKHYSIDRQYNVTTYCNCKCTIERSTGITLKNLQKVVSNDDILRTSLSYKKMKKWYITV